LFRGYFKIPENFLYLLERCRGGEAFLPLTVADIKPFDLESEIAIRLWRNDVSFITKDNKLIILVEHQSTINPNMALRLYMYHNELFQLWIKQNEINLYGRQKIEDLPQPEFYVAYNGAEPLQEEYSTFAYKSECLNIDAKVKIINIHYDNLEDTATENSLAGYAYFYKIFDESRKNGNTTDEAFEAARRECINNGYMSGFIEKEGCIVEYKKYIFDYATQLRPEGKAERVQRTAEEAIILAVENNMPHAFIEALAKKADISKERINELYEKAEQAQVAS
jgi:hypothetical protein